MERARTLPDEDTSGHFLRLAMGMFLESLTLVSANAGCALRYSLLPGDSSAVFEPFADLELHEGAQPSQYPGYLFTSRMTSRLPSNGVRIEPQATEELKRLDAELGHRYHQLDDPVLIEMLIQENILAVFRDLNDRPYHDEIVRWLRASEAESRAKSDGLDYRCMRMGALDVAVMKHLPSLMRWRLTHGFMRRQYRRQLGAFSHLGIISGDFWSDEGNLRAAKYLTRFWLELARANIYIHPFGNLITNANARARVAKLTGIKDMWLVFRIGHTAQPPRSYRRSLQEILLND
jgi:hypothetical protein